MSICTMPMAYLHHKPDIVKDFGDLVKAAACMTSREFGAVAN